MFLEMRPIVVLFLAFGANLIAAQNPIKKRDSVAFEAEAFLYASQVDSIFQSAFVPIESKTQQDLAPSKFISEIHTDTLKRRLELLNAKTPLSIVYSPTVEQYIRSYLKSRSASLETVMSRSRYYFPLFEEVFDREEVPLEIKYLAVVESALRPTAKSAAGAKGLWQFMFSTAKHYNLEVSSYVDERFDPQRSTTAAAKYLKKLYSIFKDWDLALAAYNAGPGNVTKAIRRSGGHRSYWNIRPFLPKETASYIPAFIANLYLFEYASAHGFQPRKTQLLMAQTDTIRIQNTIHFEHISEFLNIDTHLLKALNPAYKLYTIPADEERNYVLRLPIDAIGKFVSKEAEIYAFAQKKFQAEQPPLPKFYKMDSKVRYKVQPGDYLGKIANKFKVRISEIKHWNGLKNDQLKAGDRLTVYTRNLALQPESSTNTMPHKKAEGQTYVVEQGDSLWSISKKFSGISVQNLQDWNGISGKNLKPGTKLMILK
jgi:membrane-bound lytic murein transglycosylase D